MAKSSNDTVFSLTLTEVVIILFFTVILLFALKDIPPEDVDCPLDDPNCVVSVGDDDEDDEEDDINICGPGDICFGKCLQVSKEENSRGYYYLYTILIDQKDFIVKLGEDNEKVRSEFNNLPSSARTLIGVHSEVSFRNLSDPILKYELEQKCRYFVKTNYSEPTSAKELNNGLKTIDEYFLSMKPE